MSSSLEGGWVPASSWHPKITPYRLTFILTTGALGIAKAILVSQEKSASSTTVEWIAGVVVALSFQMLGSFEYLPRRHRSIDWIFSYDCLNLPKRLMRTSTSRGKKWTSSAPRADPQTTSVTFDASKPPPIVTGYRLLVSIFTSCFGFAKMVSAYRDLHSAMNTLDWILAVPLTLGFYYIGLFEDMKGPTPRRFFDVDYSRPATLALQIGLLIAASLTGAALCGLWTAYWLWAALMTWRSYSLPPLDEETLHPAFAHVLRNTVLSLSLTMVHVGAYFFLMLAWPYIRMVGGRVALWARFVFMLVFTASFYGVSISLCVHCVRLLLVPLPNGDDGKPSWMFFEVFRDSSMWMVPLFASLILCMGLWPGLAVTLLDAIRVYGFNRGFYRAYWPHA